MKNKTLLLILNCLYLTAGSLCSQTGPETYVWPKDPAVVENLKKWQGHKFGLLIHMGHIMVRTKLADKLKVSLLESEQNLKYQRFDDMTIVSIPAGLRSSLAKKEAVVIKISH